MEFATRLCRPGQAQALSLVAQATILETYAGITDGHDLVQYVTAELSVADFSTMIASDRVRVWIVERSPESVPSDMPSQSRMKTRTRFLRSSLSGSTSSTDFTGRG
jgi:hypothetical protein